MSSTLEIEIPPIDKAYATSLLKKWESPSYETFLFIAFLLAASRSGYAYVEVDGNTLVPSAEEIWGKSLDADIIQGLKDLPKNIPSIVKQGNKYYLQRLYKAEKACLEHWNRLNQPSPQKKLEENAFQNELEALKLSGELTEEQFSAVKLACEHPLFILTGGPGTGKTFTAARILRTLLKSLSEKENFHIAVTAPTGKAALTLQNSLASVCGEIPLNAKTLHALLNIRSEMKDSLPALPYDLVIVDEVSMIDMELMNHLLSSIKTGARLILLGDPHQLPPIEGPSLFATFLKNHPYQVRLSKCLRAESIELVKQAQDILEGKNFSPTLYVKPLDTSKFHETLKGYLPHFLTEGVETFEDLLKAFQRFRILTPLRRGFYGSDQINQFFLQNLLKRGVKAFPILVTSNDYQLDLFNGEQGVLISSELKGLRPNKYDYVLFSHGRKIPALLLPSFDWGYAMTVHKSQGSEFDTILLILPQEGNPYSKSLLYTAATRAKKKLVIFENAKPLTN